METTYAAIMRPVGMRLEADGSWSENIAVIYGESEDAAEQSYRQWCDECHGYDTSLPLGVLLDNYFYEVLLESRSLKPSTKNWYLKIYKTHFRGTPLTKKSVNSITAMDLKLAYNALDCSDSSLRAIHAVMKKLCAFLSLRGDGHDFTAGVEIPKRKKKARAEIEVWSDNELEIINAHLADAPRIRFLIVMLINTGCRISELLALRY
jgi:integrase